MTTEPIPTWEEAKRYLFGDLADQILDPPPKPKHPNRDRMVAVRLTAEEHRQLRAEAKAAECTISELLRNLLEAALAKRAETNEVSDTELIDKAIDDLKAVRARLAG